LLSIDRLARRHALAIIDVEEWPTHGGSLRLFLAHAGSRHEVSPRVAALLARERAAGLDDMAVFQRFAEQTRRTKRGILKFLIDAKERGKTICGYGAPGKGNTFLNYCGIGRDMLDFTVDRNPYKHGRVTPGMHIPIRPPEALAEAKPDYVLILPWNLREEIAQQLAYVADWGGKLVVAIPEVDVFDPGPR
jgi:hypothetical protein